MRLDKIYDEDFYAQQVAGSARSAAVAGLPRRPIGDDAIAETISRTGVQDEWHGPTEGPAPWRQPPRSHI